MAGYGSLSPDGKLFATTGAIWSVHGRRPIASLVVSARRVEHVAFSPDGQFVVTAGDDGAARVWDATNGTQVEAFPAGGPLWSASFSRDGTRIATVRKDGLLQIFACDLCIPLDHLLKLARSRVTRELTTEERNAFVPVGAGN
jgi:WD40 repeat protein